jgi:hypothetical protein
MVVFRNGLHLLALMIGVICVGCEGSHPQGPEHPDPIVRSGHYLAQEPPGYEPRTGIRPSRIKILPKRTCPNSGPPTIWRRWPAAETSCRECLTCCVGLISRCATTAVVVSNRRTHCASSKVTRRRTMGSTA